MTTACMGTAHTGTACMGVNVWVLYVWVLHVWVPHGWAPRVHFHSVVSGINVHKLMLLMQHEHVMTSCQWNQCSQMNVTDAT